MNACWCGSKAYTAFSDDYFLCSECGTLVYQGQAADTLEQQADAFYGEKYWTDRQARLGHPPVQTRARQDLIERNLHWLKTLSMYMAPPARVLEVGCGHGSFLALLEAAGFQATGIDLSPWIVDFARRTFNVQVRQGRVEDQDFAPGSFDCIAWMDVLEHLSDPAGSLRHSLEFLKPGGIILIQTPAYPGGTQAGLEAAGSPFMKMLLPVEHLHLFSEDSMRRLLTGLGLREIRIHPAIFPYDMFLVAGREPLPSAGGPAPAAGASGRLVSALLDLSEQKQQLQGRLTLLEADHAASDEQIHTLTDQLKAAEADRAARLEQVHTLTDQLKEAEADRTARLEQVHTLTDQLKEAEADRAARLEQVHTLTDQLKEAEADRAARLEQVHTLTDQLKEAEADRAARLEQIHTLTDLVKSLQNPPHHEAGDENQD